MRSAEVSKAAVVTLAAAVLVSMTAAAVVVVVSMAAAAVAVVGMSAAEVVVVSMAAAAEVSMSIAAAAAVGVGIAAAVDMMTLQLTRSLRVHDNIHLCHSACSADVHEVCAQCQKLSVRYKPQSITSQNTAQQLSKNIMQ